MFTEINQTFTCFYFYHYLAVSLWMLQNSCWNRNTRTLKVIFLLFPYMWSECRSVQLLLPCAKPLTLHASATNPSPYLTAGVRAALQPSPSNLFLLSLYSSIPLSSLSFPLFLIWQRASLLLKHLWQREGERQRVREGAGGREENKSLFIGNLDVHLRCNTPLHMSASCKWASVSAW